MTLFAGSGITAMSDPTLVLRKGFDPKCAVVLIGPWLIFSSSGGFIIEIGLARFGGTGKRGDISGGDMKTSLSQPRVGLSGRIYGSG